MNFICTNGDRVLCEECFNEQLDAQDEATHLFKVSSDPEATCDECFNNRKDCEVEMP